MALAESKMTIALTATHGYGSQMSTLVRTVGTEVPPKRVSFREHIDLVAIDGTVHRASLHESDLFGYVDTKDQMGFDYGSCSTHQDHHSRRAEGELISSYRKLLPRSALAYVKRM